jgi:tRNA pseudouridine55 synthase
MQNQNQTKKSRNLEVINGILLLDKPIDCTSNFILQRVKYLLQAKKAGHTGSLDPLATGMLPICFGEATKFSEFLLCSDKCYEVTGHLGVTTNTGDAQGEVLTRTDFSGISEENLNEIIADFVGGIEQIPPMYSALKHNGQCLYKYARSGIDIERKARKVNIYSIELLNFHTNTFKLRVVCSKGTYIRTLIEDIGARLGVGAHVTQLRRLYTSGFETSQMFSCADLQNMHQEDLKKILLPIDLAVQHLPRLGIQSSDAKDLFHGKVVDNLNLSSYSDGIFRLYDSYSKKFIGLGKINEGKYLKAQRLLSNLC